MEGNSSNISPLTVRRIANELKDLKSSPLPNCNVVQNGSNWNKWEVYLTVEVNNFKDR
jgi:ubiquitin-protein ligase